MLRRCILLLIFSVCANSKRGKEIYELSADDIITSELGDVYEARAILNKLVADDNDTKSTVQPTNLTALNTTTTEKVAVATVPPEIESKYVNITLRDLKKRRLQRQIEKVLSADLQPVSNYLIGVDETMVLTRRFDEMVSDYKKQNSETRREVYVSGENPKYKQNAKRVLLNLMEHFVYETRYKLVYAQLLRKKYLSNHRYKLGFLFALLRHLKNMQKWIMWSLEKHIEAVNTIYFSIKMMEKIIRLDVDMKDVLTLIEKTEYQRNIKHSPNFYDYSVEK